MLSLGHLLTFYSQFFTQMILRKYQYYFTPTLIYDDENWIYYQLTPYIYSSISNQEKGQVFCYSKIYYNTLDQYVRNNKAMGDDYLYFTKKIALSPKAVWNLE